MGMWPGEGLCLHSGALGTPHGQVPLPGLPECVSAHLMIREPTEAPKAVGQRLRGWLEVEGGRASGQSSGSPL